MSTDPSPQATLAGVYDASAAAYDRHWAPALHRHSRDLVATVPPPAPGEARTVVDVATGTGTLLPELHGLAGPGGRVLALDRSLGMLRQAPSSAHCVQADATVLPLPSGSVDVLVLAFVLFLLPDAAPAVDEAARVLRPGGWLLAATWGTQSGTGADVVVREELDRAGAPAFAALARSDDETDSAADMAALLAGGFEGVETDSRPLDARFEPDAAVAMRLGCGPLGWRFTQLDAPARDRVTERVGVRVRGLTADDLTDRSEVLLTRARRR